MSARKRDTSAEAQRVQLRGLRRMSMKEKLACLQGLNRSVLQMAMLGVRQRYPNASPREQQLRLASRWLDGETLRRVFGWTSD